MALDLANGSTADRRAEAVSVAMLLQRCPHLSITCCNCLMLLLLPIFSRWALKAWMLAAPSENRRTGENRSVGRCRVLESL